MKNAVLSFQDPFVVQVLMQNLNLNEKRAKALFGDVVKFLFLCSETEETLAPPMAIDGGWHQFITCTKNYRSFSNEFGIHIDHMPAVNGVVLGVDSTLEYLHSRTIDLAKSMYGKLSKNFKSGVDSRNWCCGGGTTK